MGTGARDRLLRALSVQHDGRPPAGAKGRRAPGSPRETCGLRCPSDGDFTHSRSARGPAAGPHGHPRGRPRSRERGRPRDARPRSTSRPRRSTSWSRDGARPRSACRLRRRSADQPRARPAMQAAHNTNEPRDRVHGVDRRPRAASTTGVSASDRARTIRAGDRRRGRTGRRTWLRPGPHLHPLQRATKAACSCDPDRPRASVDLARLAGGLHPSGVICESDERRRHDGARARNSRRFIDKPRPEDVRRRPS